VTDSSEGQKAAAIWRLSEEVLDLLRAEALEEILKVKDPDTLWLEDLTRTQANMVIAVRKACETSLEGITLKDLAERTGVSSAAASVMVESLVQKGLLERHRSESDRRVVYIRLSPETSRLFDVGDRSLQQTIVDLGDELGPETLDVWWGILSKVAPTLRESGAGDRPKSVDGKDGTRL